MTEPVPEPQPAPYEPTPSTPPPVEPTTPEPVEPTPTTEPTEPTTGEEEEDEEAEQEEVPEPPPEPVSEKEIEEGTKKLEAEATRHNNRISQIMGEAALDLVPCELCPPMLAGHRFNRQPDEIVVEKVRAVIGLSDLSGFEPANDARRCDDCNGKGRVLSGSQVEAYTTLRCTACKGQGWIPVGGRPAVELPVTVNGPADLPREELEERPPDTDPWGRAPTDPYYGVLPGYTRA